MSIRTHLLSDRASRQVVMFCGMRGSDEGGTEFTTTDGREARLFYTANEAETTCRRCQAILATTKRKGL